MRVRTPPHPPPSARSGSRAIRIFMLGPVWLCAPWAGRTGVRWGDRAIVKREWFSFSFGRGDRRDANVCSVGGYRFLQKRGGERVFVSVGANVCSVVGFGCGLLV